MAFCITCSTAEPPPSEPIRVTIRHRRQINGKAIELTGPLSAASTLSEVLLLEYGNGFAGTDLGWGRLDGETLTRVLELHTAYADLMRRTPYLARARGSNLLSHVLRSIEQAATGQPVSGALGRPGDVALVVAGHDTNLSNISGMLGLGWSLAGYPADDTPPGGALVFALWRDPADGGYFVTTKYLAQTPDQMRTAEPLTLAHPPAMQNLALPGCRAASLPDGNCPWTAFAQAVRDAIDPAFAR